MQSESNSSSNTQIDTAREFMDTETAVDAAATVAADHHTDWLKIVYPIANILWILLLWHYWVIYISCMFFFLVMLFFISFLCLSLSLFLCLPLNFFLSIHFNITHDSV